MLSLRSNWMTRSLTIQTRRDAANRLNIRVRVLDEEVIKRREAIKAAKANPAHPSSERRA